MKLTLFISLLVCTSFAQSQDIGKKYKNEIKSIVSQSSVKKAFDYLVETDQQSVNDLITLTEIPAPPFMEENRARKFMEMLISAGIDSAWTDAEGNVIGLRKGTSGKRVVVLDAHLDTVFPDGTDVKVKYVGDTLKAPGIADDTRGLSMVLAILRALEHSEIETVDDLYFIGTVGEEGLGDLRGVKYLFEESMTSIDSWISIDGGNVGRINNSGLCSVRYKVIFSGRGGHSWGAFGLGNPHHALGMAIDVFTKAATEYTGSGSKTSFNVGRIGGGTSVNSIPFESWMEVDMRAIDPERLKGIEAIFKESMKSGLNEYNQTGVKYPVELELIKIGDRPSGEVSVNEPLIQRALAATESFGVVPELTRGSTNSNIPISLGIPAITIGRGGKGGNAHSLHEWWMNDDGVKAIQLALLIVLAEVQIKKR